MDWGPGQVVDSCILAIVWCGRTATACTRGCQSAPTDTELRRRPGARRRQCPECGRRFTTVESASLSIVKRSGATEPFSRQKVLVGVRKACQGRPVTEDDLAVLAQRVEESIRAQGSAEIEAHEVGLAVLEPLRELDEVAYLRFASVYQAFDNLEDFEAAITLLRAERDATGQEPAGQQPAAQPAAQSATTTHTE